MKKNSTVNALLLLFVLLGWSGTLVAQDLVKRAHVSATETNLEMASFAPDAYQLNLSGPADYQWQSTVTKTPEIKLSNRDENGKVFADGAYLLQVTPIFHLTAEQQAEMRKLSDHGDKAGLATFRAIHQIPDDLPVYAIHFSIQNGKFITPEEETEQASANPMSFDKQQSQYASLFGSVQQKTVNYRPTIAKGAQPLSGDHTSVAPVDQVFNDDVIISSSLCVGFDCVNGENFGSDTERLKENNLRLHFDDTSNSASFPSNDWRITVNDQTNGGQSYFAIEDATAGRIPFRVKAGAPANSLVVDNNGDVGIGNLDPVLELHITDGDSPSVRLEQNGSSGFGEQTWDIAANETNFFIRDVTNGSLLPFRIKPGAPKNTIFMDSNGEVGFGSENPSAKVHVESGDVYVKNGKIGVNVVPTVPLDVVGNFKVTGTSFMTGDETHVLTTGSTTFNSTFSTIMRLDAVNARVGIGTPAPGHQLELSTDDAYKPSGGSWLGASDRRLKKDINEFTDGLGVLMQIRPVTYRYNGMLDLPTDKEYIGVIAQEMQAIAPYTIEPLNNMTEAGQKEDYLAYDGSSVTYILVNAVQEQQQIIAAQQKEIDQLKNELAQVEELKAQMAALAQTVEAMKGEKQAKATPAAHSDDK